MNNDNESIDPRKLIKELAADQVGLFEPLSGMMLVNASRAELLATNERLSTNAVTEEDVALLRTINHETFHFAQAAASGFMFERQRMTFAALNSAEDPFETDPDEEKMRVEMVAMLDEEAGDDPALLRRRERLLAVIAGNNYFAKLNESAAPGDHSIVGALIPGLFKHLAAQAEREREPNDDGLSITGVLEGSAVVHTHLLMRPNGDAHLAINSELETLPATYHELIAVTAAAVGERTLELLLPTTALALRYAQPHNAYLPLLRLLATCEPGDGLARGRIVAASLPELAGAGPILGTAGDVRKRHDDYRLYDQIIGKLDAGDWGVDAYDFLAEPSAMHRVTRFPFGLVTSDGYFGPLERLEVAARMAIMSGVLRTASRRHMEREFNAFLLEWGREVIGRLIGAND